VEQGSWANIPRYAYRSLEKPATGDRFKAQGSFTQAVEAHRDQRLTEAMTNYQQAILADPAFYEAHYNLGLASYEAKDWAVSLSAYETALSINPTSANCRYNFALALQQAGFYLDAADELEKLIAQSPGEARAHLTLASLYADELGKPLLARPHYMKVLELEPQHSQAPAIRYWLASNP
jgi:tetratricopeptide (TPR) repeat protein